MKTVKEVAELTGISIRTLRYYDEINLLKPPQHTNAGYRLYDNQALEQLQQIMFFRELEIPLAEVRTILTNPEFNKMNSLALQKALLEKKRNRLNGLIELISDVLEGDNTMSFEAFTEEDFTKIIDHSLTVTDNQLLIEKFGSLDHYREFLTQAFEKNEQTNINFIQLYGSRNKALKAIQQQGGKRADLRRQKEAIDDIYNQFSRAMKTDNSDLARAAVEKLAENYKSFFKLDNARALLLELADGYLHQPQLGHAIEEQFGLGITVYIAQAIQRYYGV